MTTISDYQQALNETQRILGLKSNELGKAQSELAAKETEIQLLREKLRLLQHRQFGKSAESYVSEDQISLPGYPQITLPSPVASEEADDQAAKEDSASKEGQASGRKKSGRRPLCEDWPKVERVIDIPESQKTCSVHGVALEKIGEERSQSIEHVPESFKVLVTIRPKYLCPCCEEKKVSIAPVPLKLIPKSLMTPSLLTQIVIAKFVDHLPLYRQESIYSRAGLDLCRGTMAEWILKLGEALIPLTNLLQEKLLEGSYLSCDETPLRVLTDQGKRVKNLHYLWIRSRHKEFGQPIYLFEYASSRRAKVAKEILEGFKGYLQVDQYVGYDFAEKLEEIIRVGCFAHIRRKFHEAQKAMTNKSSIPGKVLSLIKKLYKIEEEVASLNESIRTERRKALAEPLLLELQTFLQDSQRKVPPQSATGKAISYTLNSWATLLPIYDDYRIKLDNNLTENAIRPVAVGRKNYLFCHSAEGAAAAARIYSLISTAKANGLNLREYFTRLIDQLPQAKSIEDFEALLPLA